MAHPTRTGDLVVFAYPPYQFDAATPGTPIALSAFFGQHGYVPDVQDLKSNTNMRATFLAGGDAIERGELDDVRSRSTSRRRRRSCSASRRRSTARASCGATCSTTGATTRRSTSSGLNDFHGQLKPGTTTYDTITNVPAGGAAQLATLFDEERAKLPGDTLLLSGGDNVGASPPESSLLEDMPTIDVLNAWNLDATAFGNHEFDYGPARILKQQARSSFDWLSANIVETATGQPPSYVKPSAVYRVNGEWVGVIGATVKNTPELVAAGNTAGLSFLDEAERIKRESQRLRERGREDPGRRHPRGRDRRAERGRRPDGGAVDGADHRHRQRAAGHDDRPRRRRAHAPAGQHGRRQDPGRRGLQRGRQLLRRPADGRRTATWQWAGTATRTAKSLGVAPRADVKAIVDKANADTLALRVARDRQRVDRHPA